MSVETVRDIVVGFLGAGGSLIDASLSTNSGAAVRLLGAVLSDFPRDEIVLSASAGVRPESPLGARVDCSRKSLTAAIDRTLQELSTDCLDIFSVEYWDEQTPPEEVKDTLDLIVRSGKAHYAGVRDYSGWQLAVSYSPWVSVAQSEYNLLDRTAEQELLPASQHLGVGFIASSSLAQGILTGKYRDGSAPVDAAIHTRLDERSARIVDALGTAAAGLGISPATAALAWTQARPGVSSALVSITEPGQLADILPAATSSLPAAIVAALDDISAL